MPDTSAPVYVVDDDASVREAVEGLLSSVGLRARTFPSAQEFLANFPAAVPSCLVLDVKLPGLSGLDLQQELAKADLQLPIIFLTGHGDVPTSVRAMKAGALEFLTKPIDDELLLDAIRKGIAEHQLRLVRSYGISTEIEDRKQVEGKLRQNEREPRQITDAIAQTIVANDTDGTPIYANKAMLDYTGLTIDDVIHPDFHSRITHPEDFGRVQGLRQAALLRGLPYEFEVRARRKDGQYRWLLNQCTQFYDEQKRLTRWYSTGTDIEDRNRAEDLTKNENVALREGIDHDSMFEEIVGSSDAIRQVLEQVAKVAPTDSTVLISGETGTGKELIARAIHKRSKRAARAFIRVNCGAVASSLIASELFGHEKGAFTGAFQRRIGHFEAADCGTIFLDEIGDLPAETQIALLRVLQEREFQRVGSSQSVSIDVRVLAATNGDLTSAVAAGKFRQDLFYRLNVFPVRLPPLRERPEDIPLLVEYLVARYAQKAGKKFRDVTSKTLQLFQTYRWPGNIRELQNVIERAIVLCDGDTFSVDERWLRQESSLASGSVVSLVTTLEDRERQMIEEALVQSRGKISGPAGAAAKLGIPRQTLERRILSLCIDKYQFKSH